MAKDMKWNGPQFQRHLEAEMGRRLDASAIVVQNHAKELIGREGAGKVPKSKTLRSGRKVRKGNLVYGAVRSKPGEPPMKQAGRLQTSVSRERIGMVARVGTNVKYGRWLELGTANMAARPWLVRALFEKTPTVNAIISRPMVF